MLKPDGLSGYKIEWLSEDAIEFLKDYKIIQIIDKECRRVDSGTRIGSPFGEIAYIKKMYYLCLLEMR